MLGLVIVIVYEVHSVGGKIMVDVEVVEDFLLESGEIVLRKQGVKNDGIVDGFPVNGALFRADGTPFISSDSAVVPAPEHRCPDKDRILR